MAAQDYTSVVQQLYVSYFGRPADYYGLQSFSAALDAMNAPKTFAEINAAVQADKAGTTALSKLVNSFNSSAESAALYGTDNSQIGIGKFVNAIYQNVLGRDADKTGFDFWVDAITTGTLTKANAAASITQAALTNTSDQGKLDTLTVQNKLAVATTFTTGLDTPAEITAFSGDAAAASARSLLSSVTNTTNLTTYQASIDASIADIVSAANPGKTFALTDSVDTLVGSTGNDTFNATADTLTALDKIDGAGGRDTLVVADADGVMNKALPAGVAITNVEKLVVNTAGSLGQIAVAGSAAIPAVTAQAEVRTITPTVVNAASTSTLSVTYNGVTQATAPLDATATEAEVAAAIVATMNAIAGASVAAVSGNNVVVTAPVAGTALPAFTVSSTVPGEVTFSTATTTANRVAAAEVPAVAAVTAAVFDTTSITGLTEAVVTAAGSINAKIAGTTSITATNTGAGGVTIDGGKSVIVTTGAAGAVNVTGAALTNVSVKGGTVVNVNNTASSGSGSTLTAVTLDGIAGGATLTGAALTSVALNNLASAQTVTVANATASHTLNVAANAAGSSTAQIAVADAAATTVAITAAGKSNLAVNAAAATKVTVNAADATTVNLAGAQTKLAIIDASASAGAVTLTNIGTGVTSITTGAGADKLTVTTATSAATTTVAAVTATVSTGAGNDDITIATTGAGGYTVNAGEGNDKITVTQGLLVAGSTINGGAGDDTLVLGNGTAAFAAGDYAVINSLVSNVEAIQFQAAVGGIDASKVAFTSMTFAAAASTVTGVTTQSLSTSGTLTATASGYVNPTTGDTTYAGNLNVTATGAASDLTLNADTATVNVKAGTAANVAATIGGDLQTSLTVNLTNSANASSDPTGDRLSSATIEVNGTDNTALKSIVLTGAGTVTIDASASQSLTTIDASKLGGTIANGTTKGNITGGLDFTGNAAIAETIILGSGSDIVTIASTYGNMDSITGFDAVKEGSTAASTTDVLEFAGLVLNGTTALVGNATSVTGTSKLTLTAAESTLDLAFVKAAAASDASSTVVQFQFGGNTYLFADDGDGILENTDFAVKLVGTVDVVTAFGIAPTV